MGLIEEGIECADTPCAVLSVSVTQIHCGDCQHGDCGGLSACWPGRPHTRSHCLPTRALRGGQCCQPHLANEETKAQVYQVTSPKMHHQEVVVQAGNSCFKVSYLGFCSPSTTFPSFFLLSDTESPLCHYLGEKGKERSPKR